MNEGTGISDNGVSDSGKPLEGIRVLEVAMYGFVPSAGAVLAEWGAARRRAPAPPR